MKNKNDIFNLVIDDNQKDRIIDLVDRLPSQFFSDDPEWVDTVKKLYSIIKKVEDEIHSD